jgi:pimeloyl-ACP methyl ester carboxylesterase
MPETRFTETSGVRIAFEDLGGAGGEPLLLVMGLGASRFWWPRGLVDELVGHGFQVVAYDQRDAGESERVRNGADTRGPIGRLLNKRQPAYTAEQMTDDAAAVLDALGWNSAHLFGHSMGGLLAQRIGLRHPHRVRSVTSSAALPSDARGAAVLRHVRPGFVLRSARLRAPEGPEGDLALAMAMSRLLASPGHPFDEERVRAAAGTDLAHGVQSFRDTEAQGRQIGAPWSGPRLAELAVPALVLHGDADPVLRVSAARATAAAIPAARLRVFPGVGHEIPRDAWRGYAREVAELAGCCASAAP